MIENNKSNPGNRENLKTPEREKDCKTLQEWLDWKYPTSEEKAELKVINLSDVNFTDKKLEKGKLDLQGFVNLETFLCSTLFTEINLITELDVSHNPKLTNLYINDTLFIPKNKVIGLEKTSIIDLRCYGDLLEKSQDPQFIWEVFIRKYNAAFPEMKLINISDIGEKVKQKDWNKVLWIYGQSHLIIIYREIRETTNEILRRCQTVMSQLYHANQTFTNKESKRDRGEISESYEKSFRVLRKGDPKPLYTYSYEYFYANREKLVNRTISGDQNLLACLQNLSYLNPKYKLKLIDKLKNKFIKSKQNHKDQLEELNNILLPNQELNFTNLKEEVQRLKVQSLTPQLETKKNQLTGLINKLNQKVGFSLEKVLKSYLDTYISILQENNTFKEGQLSAYENILVEKLNKTELKNLTDLQKEVSELEEQLETFQKDEYKFQIEITKK